MADPTDVSRSYGRPNGPRLGLWWRVTIVFAYVTGVWWVVFHAANGIWGSTYDRTSHVVRAATTFILVVPVVLLARRYLDRATLSGIGLTTLRNGWRPLLFGLGCWLVPAAVGTTMFLAFSWVELTALKPVDEILSTAGQLVVLVLIFEALPEELVFRGYLQSNLATRWGPWPAVWAQAVLFLGWGVLNGGEVSLERAALLLVFAVALGRLRLITGTVWAPIGFHLAFQTVAQLFGTAGGAFEATPPNVLAVIVFGALPFSVAFTVRWTKASRPADANTSPPPPDRPALVVRGVNYDTGTCYLPGLSSRPEWSDEAVRRDLHAIADDLHANTVNLFGDQPARLIGAATLALEAGLNVWLQPRPGEVPPEQALAFLRDVCVAAETIRERHPGRITVAFGCELSIFQAGIVPGRTYVARTALITVTWAFLSTMYDRRLNRHLRRAVTIVRRHFHGDVTYAAGAWERIDWDLFDLVGVNLYRDRSNHQTYRDEVRSLHRFGKPVVITEFGCCTYDGAEHRGAVGDTIVDWRADPPAIKGNHTRDEEVQADYLADLLGIFVDERVHGAFVFEFAEPAYPHLLNPRHDLDIASYAIVKSRPSNPDRGVDDAGWEPKAAFHRIADLYQTSRARS